MGIENEIKPKTPEELQDKFDILEDSIMELISQLGGYSLEGNDPRNKIAKIEERHFEVEQKLHNGEMNLTDSVIEFEKILKELESFTS